MRNGWVLAFVCVVVSAFHARCESDDLDTQIMLNTFKVANPKSTATVFMIARRTPDGQDVIVTAAHVFTKMEGDEASLNLRKKDPKDADIWIKVPIKIKIRQGDKPLWTKHPDADIAVMPFTIPAEIPAKGLPFDLFATDEMLKQYEIHPGDTVKCAGFPHGVFFNSGPAWFPVIRSGGIAGFPLTPMSKYKTFLADFSIFEGNSGGPIYFTDNNRYYAGKTQSGRIQFIMGLLSEQHFIDNKFETPYESGKFRHQLNLGVFVNSGLIRDTITMLSKNTTAPAADKTQTPAPKSDGAEPAK